MDKIPYQLIPLFNASEDLADVMDDQETVEKITDADIARAFEAKLIQAREIDAVIEFFDRCKSELARLKENEAYYRSVRKSMEALVERLKDGCKAIVEKHVDEDGKRIPFQGKRGKLAVQNNAPSVQYEFDELKLTEQMVSFIGIPDKYLRRKVSFELDKNKIKAELQSGTFPFNWAWLDQKNHLRVRR